MQRVVMMAARTTGRSTLSERLAQEFKTEHVQEYGLGQKAARSWQRDLDDHVTIERGYSEREDEAVRRANPYLVIDTNAITTMCFSPSCNRDSRTEPRLPADDCCTRYRHVIVCDDDISFEQDGWRDNVVRRGRMQGIVLHDLATRRIPFPVVSGSLDERVAQVRSNLRGQQVGSTRHTDSLGQRPMGIPR